MAMPPYSKEGIGMRFRKLVIGLLLACACSSINAASKYIDNESGDDSNDGSTPALAKKTLPITIVNWYQPGDTIYVRATETPYRLQGVLGPWNDTTWYFDWTGSENERGAKKAKIYGSERVPLGGWACQGDVCMASSPVGRVGGAYIDKTIPTKLSHVTSYGSLQPGQYFFYPTVACTNPDGKKCPGSIFYRIDTMHPDGLPIEWIPDDASTGGFRHSQAIEATVGSRFYNAVIRYFNYGFSHGGCSTREVAGLDVGYNLRTGMRVASNVGADGFAIFHDNISHHNGGNGFTVIGYNNLQFTNNKAFENDGDGFNLEGQGENTNHVSVNEALVTNNTAHFNSGAGFRISTSNGPYPTHWVLTNNTSVCNNQGEFNLLDATEPVSASSNLWAGINSDLFKSYAGDSNVPNDCTHQTSTQQ